MSRSCFEITLHRAARAAQPEAFVFEPQRYTRHEARAVVAEATFPWSEALLEQLTRLQRDPSDAGARAAIGATLRDFLKQTAWPIPEQDLLRAPAAGQGPALLTISTGAAELYALPWELATLPASGRALAELPHLLLRYEWPGLPPAAPAAADDRPPRLIVAWSDAAGAVPAADHLRWIEDAVAPARTGGVAIQELPRVSGPLLEQALATASGPVVLHLLCHGTLRDREDGRSAALCWNAGLDGDDGTLAPDRLRRLLAPFAGKLRLVVLCACLSGDHDPLGLHVGSLAQAIHRLGIPSVVASRFPLSVPGSVRLTRVLYRALLVEGASLEIALLQARAALLSERGKAAEESAGDDGGSLAGDALALQLYARSEEWVRTDDGAEARRALTATWPFSIPRRPPETPAPFLVRFPDNEGFFVGRATELDDLHALLRRARAGGLCAGLQGLGGIGKTQLAVRYVYAHRRDYPGGIYWVDAGGPDWRPALADLARRLKLPIAEPGTSREAAQAFADYLRARPDALVVLDNVQDPGDLLKDRAAGFRAPDGRTYRENVGRSARSGEPVSRERRALDDIEAATGERPGYTPYDR